MSLALVTAAKPVQPQLIHNERGRLHDSMCQQVQFQLHARLDVKCTHTSIMASF